ncbi:MULTISPECIES: hypothetical protein [Sphingomonas]|jgi:hypothetical protein|uniref:Uncharacterized protein n=1 Tax=Sphingomonas zeae TaxID=1646122 RepID=A0A7Y6B599_9SPHN|nr:MULTISPECIES: hypothetical protein [Sphingomonas]MBB4048900.1 hypothetical protein [Sphingomonas zeae]MDK8185956.1 hypothetical protein [Sphingomonas zeae]MDK8215264.1 hypothetical protein [Sphingomonas sp. UMB7805-LC452B]NUU47265.1 hypothetical protein [Sphingomonas zeae]
MTEIPPSRFRVVERGRRLEVIDTQAGKMAPARRIEAPRPTDGKTSRLKLPEKLRFDGGGSWTTDGFYDAKGPRTVTLDAGAMQRLRYAGAGLVAVVIVWALLAFAIPIVWGAPMLLLNPKVRETVREQVTGFIDGLDRVG